ncbi:hypothetical protein [Microlunatus soli]|uniref:DUF3137 domain-containing protein n=1 Tax=Microlunatus soli TaxID=630515 RepID=A0A1H1U3Y6_9ACTN|nr:hypothetical protein [Microlunatus soli]SDS67074.1 hypothetical protein SAMN04489812_2627 [Microlunatus soli]
MENVGVLTLVLFVVIIAIGVALGFLTRRRRRQRQQEVGRFAASRGWQFIDRDDSYSHRWQGKPFASRGMAHNIIIGQHRGRSFCTFAYHYTTTSHTGQVNTTQSHDFVIFAIALPAPVPEFSVEAEGIFGGKVAEALGFERIDSGDPDFDNTFKVKSDNPRFGALLLQPPLLQMLKSTGPWDWRLTGQDMLSYQKGHLAPELVQPRLDLMCDVLDRIPNDAWRR